MTLWQLSALVGLILAAASTVYVVVLRHLEEDPGGWHTYDTAADDEDTRAAWMRALANTGTSVERGLAREFKRRGRLLVGPRRTTVARRARQRRNGGGNG